MRFEKKTWTNLYWNTQRQDLVASGMYGTEKAATDKIMTDVEHLVFQESVPATLEFGFNGPLIKEKFLVEKTVEATA